ncbi:MAG: 1-acyl-sn-glycerol-3-phosphate acyltransferase [Streptosporangiaceae bacterium]
MAEMPAIGAARPAPPLSGESPGLAAVAGTGALTGGLTGAGGLAGAGEPPGPGEHAGHAATSGDARIHQRSMTRRRLHAVAVLPPAFAVLCLFLCLLPIARLIASRGQLPGRVRSAARLVAVIGAYLAAFEIPALLGVLREGPRADQSAGQTACPSCQRAYRRRLARFFGPGLAAAGMRIVRDPASAPIPAGRPVLLLFRHAGLLNAPFASHITFEDLRRTPHIVGKSVLCADPALGLLLRHLPMSLVRWNRVGRARVMTMMTDQARHAPAETAILMGPEGTNFSAARRQRAIAKLHAQGRDGEAALAAGRAHVLPPHLTGVLALLQAAPGADVVVVGHTGLESLLVWAATLGCRQPADGAVHLTWWHVPAEEIPATTTERQAWLLDWWGRIDSWIGDHCHTEH